MKTITIENTIENMHSRYLHEKEDVEELSIITANYLQEARNERFNEAIRSDDMFYILHEFQNVSTMQILKLLMKKLL